METVLDVTNLAMHFGGLKAVDNVDFNVRRGEIVALIGPNGAGKTTFFNCVTGVKKPTAGKIVISPPGKESENITGMKANKVTERGLARTFQNIRLFQNMTVLENIMIGRHCRLNAGVLGAIFRDRKTREEEEKVIEDSYEILKKIELEKWVNELAKKPSLRRTAAARDSPRACDGTLSSSSG